MITLKEAFEDLRDRMMKQLGETGWEIVRVKPMNTKKNIEIHDVFGNKKMISEVEKFQGEGAIKKFVLEKLKDELRERIKNLIVLDEMIEIEKKLRKKLDREEILIEEVLAELGTLL